MRSESFSEFSEVKGKAHSIGLCSRFYAIQVVHLNLFSILLNPLSSPIFLIILPSDLIPHSILSQYPESFLLIAYKVALVDSSWRDFPSISVLFVLLPRAGISIA